jgi:hypothetical protein
VQLRGKGDARGWASITVLIHPTHRKAVAITFGVVSSAAVAFTKRGEQLRGEGDAHHGNPVAIDELDV